LIQRWSWIHAWNYEDMRRRGEEERERRFLGRREGLLGLF
jgi:hypothetical protein